MTRDKLHAYIALAVIILGLMFLYSRRAQAVTLADAQNTGWLPGWVTPDDSYRVLAVKEGVTFYLYHCIEDATTKAQWVLRTRRGAEREVREGRLPLTLNQAKVPLITAQTAVCFSSPPPLPGPKALGEPAYWSLIRTKAGVLDYAAMSKPENVAGSVVAGERCAVPAASSGFFLLPRLNAAGRTPLTKCQ